MSSLASTALPLLRTCRYTGRIIAEVAKRSFASSSRTLRQRTVPRFRESSSPELDDLLSTIRAKIIFPGYLTEHQQKLVYARKYASQLENDPTYATIGDEDFCLEHIDKTKNIPNAAKSIHSVFKFTKDHNDWLNWLALLRGLHEARAKCLPEWKGKFVRKACGAGQLWVVIEALNQVERNGVSMGIQGVRHAVFLGLRTYANNMGWDEEAVHTSLKYAQQAADLMEHPEHCGRRVVAPNDPRADPVVIGVLLELAARAAQYQDGDGSPRVLSYVQKLVAALEQQTTDLGNDEMWTNPTDTEKSRPKTAKGRAFWLNFQIAKWMPVWHGLRLTTELRSHSFSGEVLAATKTFKEVVEEKLNLAYTRWKEQNVDGTASSAAKEWANLRESK